MLQVFTDDCRFDNFGYNNKKSHNNCVSSAADLLHAVQDFVNCKASAVKIIVVEKYLHSII